MSGVVSLACRVGKGGAAQLMRGSVRPAVSRMPAVSPVSRSYHPQTATVHPDGLVVYREQMFIPKTGLVYVSLLSSEQSVRVAEICKQEAPSEFDLHLELSEIQAEKGRALESNEPFKILSAVKEQIVQSDPVYAAVKDALPEATFNDHCALRLPNKTSAFSVIRQLILSNQFVYPGIYPSNDAEHARFPILNISILGVPQQATFLVASEPDAPVQRVFISWLPKEGDDLAPRLDQPLRADTKASLESELSYLIPAYALSEKFETVLAPNHFALDVRPLGFQSVDSGGHAIEDANPEAIQLNRQTVGNLDDPDLDQRAMVTSDPSHGAYLEIVYRHSLRSTGMPTIGFANPTSVANIGGSSAAVRVEN